MAEDNLGRIKCNSVTETLMSALEDAEDVEHVLVIVQRKKDSPRGGYSFYDNELTVEQANFLCDLFKHWMFSCFGGVD